MFYQTKFLTQFIVTMLLVTVFATLAFWTNDSYFRYERHRNLEGPAKNLAEKASHSRDPQKFIKDYNTYTAGTLPYTVEYSQSLESAQDSRPTIVALSQGRGYLFLTPHHVDPRGKHWPFLILFLSLLGSSGLALAVSFFFLFKSMAKRNGLAENIIAEIKNGNLKARFPLSKDRFSQNMASFNVMADEIEKLVERLKETEQARMVLLQQLAHDLRTPIASLKNLLETLSSTPDKISTESKSEILSLSLKEALYFEHLVEDLLFLAQVSEPKYTVKKTNLSLSDLVDEQLSFFPDREGLKVKTKGMQDKCNYFGDQRLLERLFRNALSNAFSFAKANCIIEVEKAQGIYKISIFNDGPPMSQTDIVSFGQRKISRHMSKNAEGRVSIGLGSVIMDTIARAHGGSLLIKNVSDPIPGVLLLLELPI